MNWERIPRSLREEKEAIIDSHTHAGIDAYNFFTPRYPFCQSLRDLRAKAKRNGVNFIICFPMPLPFYYHPLKVIKSQKWIATDLEDFPYQRSNEALLYEARLFSGCALPFLAIDPKEKVKQQVEFLKEKWQTQGFFGLKLHTLATRSTAKDLIGSPFVNFMLENNLPIVIHTGMTKESLPKHILGLAKACPRLRICAAHLAGFDQETLHKSRQHSNLFFDISPFLSHCSFVAKGIKTYVSENPFPTDFKDPATALVDISFSMKGKLIWGTDEPWTSISDRKGRLISNFTYRDECFLLQELDKRGFRQIRKEITHDNILSFLFG